MEGQKESSSSRGLLPPLSCSSVARRICSWSSCQTQRVSDQVSTFGACTCLSRVPGREEATPFSMKAVLTPAQTALPAEGLRVWGSRPPL